MRLADSINVVLSRDISSNPQQILMKQVEVNNEDSLLTESVEVDQPFPVATTAISMGTIALGKFLYIKPTATLSILLNGGVEPIIIRGGKVTKMWCDFTALSLVVTGAVNQVHVVIAGA